jgi:hypothetical protein
VRFARVCLTVSEVVVSNSRLQSRRLGFCANHLTLHRIIDGGGNLSWHPNAVHLVHFPLIFETLAHVHTRERYVRAGAWMEMLVVVHLGLVEEAHL